MTGKEAILVIAAREGRPVCEVRAAMEEAILDAFTRGKKEGHPFWQAYSAPPTPEEFIELMADKLKN